MSQWQSTSCSQKCSAVEYHSKGQTVRDECSWIMHEQGRASFPSHIQQDFHDESDWVFLAKLEWLFFWRSRWYFPCLTGDSCQKRTITKWWIGCNVTTLCVSLCCVTANIIQFCNWILSAWWKKFTSCLDGLGLGGRAAFWLTHSLEPKADRRYQSTCGQEQKTVLRCLDGALLSLAAGIYVKSVWPSFYCPNIPPCPDTCLDTTIRQFCLAEKWKELRNSPNKARHFHCTFLGIQEWLTTTVSLEKFLSMDSSKTRSQECGHRTKQSGRAVTFGTLCGFWVARVKVNLWTKPNLPV